MTYGRAIIHPALAFVILAWGLNFTAIKLVYLGFSPAAGGLLRYFLMVPLLLAWCFIAKVPLKYPRGKVMQTNLAGFWGSGVYMVVFLEGMRLANPAHAAAALATAPVWTVIFSALTKHDILTWRLGLGSMIAYVGVFTMSVAGGSERGELLGTVLVAVSAIVWAWSVICYRRLMPEQQPLQALTLSFPGAMLVMGAYGLMPLVQTDFTAVPERAWWAMAYFAVVAGVLAFAAYYRGLKDVGPATASLTQFFIPPTAAIGAWLLLANPIGWPEWLGLGLVTLGTYVCSAGRRQPVPAVSTSE